MNLKEILNHRNNCLICGSPMTYHIPDYPNLQFEVFEKGLRIHSGNNRGIVMLFGFDGTYQKNKRHYGIYKSSITVTKNCDICSAIDHKLESDKYFILNFSSLGLLNKSLWKTNIAPHTSLTNMKTKECSYRFQLMGDAEGNHTCTMKHESIRYYDEESFWHIDTSFVSDSSRIHHSNFDAQLDQILSLHIPAVINLNSLKTPGQFIDKCRMYITLS